MRILVIGGTRFIGAAAVRRLASAGHEVTVFHRGNNSRETPGISELRGDRHQLLSHAQELRAAKPDVVLDMMAVVEKNAHDLLQVFQGYAQRVVLISSCDVYRAYGVLIGKEEGIEPTPVNESSPLRKKLYPYRNEVPRDGDDPRKFMDDYDKIPIESALLGQQELPACVLRLPMVYGPCDYQRRMSEYLRRMADNRPFILLDNDTATWRTSRGFVEDVAHAITLAVENPAANGKVYNVAEETFHTEKEWIDLIASAANWKGDVIVLPNDDLPESLRQNANVAQDLTTSSEKIRSELGYREVTSQVDAIAQTMEWELATMPKDEIDYSAEDAAAAARR